MSVATFLLLVIAFAVVRGWLYNRTQRSLLLAILAHTSLNANQLALINPLFGSMAATELNAQIGIGALAAAIVGFTRGGLGYGQAQGGSLVDRPN